MTTLAAGLKGVRLLQINSTDKGGGVATLLASSLPLVRDLGLDAEWHVLRAPDSFFEITRKIHDGIQGGAQALTPDEWDTYEAVNQEAASQLDARDWDMVVIHDPQPCAIASFVPRPSPPVWIWRCHIDSSRPNESYRERLLRYTRPYDALVFTLPQYAFDGLRQDVNTILPAIDPLEDRNTAMTPEEAGKIIASYGVDPTRPLITQVSRFDRWKDPVGVLRAFKRAKKRVPQLQLALVGEMALDDHTGPAVLEEVRQIAHGMPDVHIIVDKASDRDVNAFQTASLAVLQKSLREGFGLTVSEALWCGTPVIGGNAGGIPQQIRPGETGFLVQSPEEAADCIVELARDPARAERMGRAGRADVQRRFLLPRMLRDEMRLWSGLIAKRQPKPGVP